MHVCCYMWCEFGVRGIRCYPYNRTSHKDRRFKETKHRTPQRRRRLFAVLRAFKGVCIALWMNELSCDCGFMELTTAECSLICHVHSGPVAFSQIYLPIYLSI